MRTANFGEGQFLVAFCMQFYQLPAGQTRNFPIMKGFFWKGLATVNSTLRNTTCYTKEIRFIYGDCPKEWYPKLEMYSLSCHLGVALSKSGQLRVPPLFWITSLHKLLSLHGASMPAPTSSQKPTIFLLMGDHAQSQAQLRAFSKA